MLNGLVLARSRDNEGDVGLLDNEMKRELLELGYGLLGFACLDSLFVVCCDLATKTSEMMRQMGELELGVPNDVCCMRINRQRAPITAQGERLRARTSSMCVCACMHKILLTTTTSQAKQDVQVSQPVK
jgi:hypothetical protein